MNALRVEVITNLHGIYNYDYKSGGIKRAYHNSMAVMGFPCIALIWEAGRRRGSHKELIGIPYCSVLQMPGSDSQDLLALQKAIHSSNHPASRQKDWHADKMAEIQSHVSESNAPFQFEVFKVPRQVVCLH